MSRFHSIQYDRSFTGTLLLADVNVPAIVGYSHQHARLGRAKKFGSEIYTVAVLGAAHHGVALPVIFV